MRLLPATLLLAACGAPPMGPADPTTNGNLPEQMACTERDAGADATVAQTRAVIDACRCTVKAAHGEPCPDGGAP